MSIARITTGLQRAGRSNTGVVFGDIWLEVDQRAFPESGWSDFIVIVLSSLVVACVRLMRHDAARITVRFMEGPYLVELSRQAAGFRLECIHAGLRRRTVDDALVEVRPFAESLLAAADATLRMCEERWWWSSDTDTLKGAAAVLREEVKKLLA